jgi:putative ABC transport system permease protein
MMPAEMWKFIPGWERLGVNGDVLIFALAAGSAAGILSGIAPALFASRTHLEDALKDGGRGSSGGARRHRVRNVFVTAQIVPAMVLLVGAVMMVKGLRLVTEPAPNLDPAHALTMRITLPPAQYPDAARQRIFAQRVLDGVTAVAGVETPALIRNLPYSNRHASSSILVAGRESDRESVDAAYQWISSRYFEAMRLPILTGRAFGSGDDENGAPTAIVSESFARREFPNGDAIGRQLREGPAQSATPWMTIVGVAGNLRTDPFQFGFEETVYRPFRQVPVDSFSVLLRIPVPGSLAAPAAAAIHAVDAELPVYDVMSLEKVFSLQVSPVRLIASLLGSFGVLALILSSVGVYSIMAHSVSERKREIGVRVAMGAERSQVVWMFVRQSLWLAGIGMVIGAPAAYGFARLLQAVFYGVIAADGMVFTMAACAIVSAAVLASYSAARRAAGIDPVATLREE